MGAGSGKILLYSQQSRQVVERLMEDGVVYSKEAYVAEKYGESAKVFLSAYRWLAGEMVNYVPKPEGAELPYWAFGDTIHMEYSDEGGPLKLLVPVEEALFFDMYDWNQVLSLRYMGSERERAGFRKELEAMGVRQESDILLTSFYPQLKAQVTGSWQKLFFYHEAVKQGETVEKLALQAALWRIKKDWIIF